MLKILVKKMYKTLIRIQECLQDILGLAPDPNIILKGDKMYYSFIKSPDIFESVKNRMKLDLPICILSLLFWNKYLFRLKDVGSMVFL